MAGTPGRPTRQGGDSSSWHCGGIARNSRDKSSAWWGGTEGVIGCSHDLCLHAYLYGSRQKTVQHETGQRRASTATLQSEILLLPRKARLGKEKVGIPSGRASLQRRGPRAEVGVAGKRNAAVAGGEAEDRLEDARTCTAGEGDSSVRTMHTGLFYVHGCLLRPHVMPDLDA